MARKRVVKKRLLQNVSVTTQVASWRRVSRFKLQIRDRQVERMSKEGGMLDPHRRRGYGA